MIQVSIIIPVYNVEKYISPCLESLFRQGLDDHVFEIIIINDGSTDRSMEMISGIITQHRNVSVINQTNQGLSVARNVGMEKASGRYVLFVDSDDFLIDNSLSKMLSYAVSMSADMVIGDFLKLYDTEIIAEKYRELITKSDPEIVFSGNGTDYYTHYYDQWAYVWRVMYNKDFLVKNQIAFIPGMVWEDIPYMIKCLLSARSLIKVSLPFYIYRQHGESMGNSLNKKMMIDTNRVMEILWNMKIDPLLTQEVKNDLIDTLYTTFVHYKWRIILKEEIFSERREIIDDLFKRIPDLFFSHGFKQLATSILFRLMPYRYFEIRKYTDNTIRKFKDFGRFLIS